MSVSVLAHSKTGGNVDGGKATHDETNVSGTSRLLKVIEILRKRITGGACMLQLRKTMADRHDERAETRMVDRTYVSVVETVLLL